uniref:Coiled-coil SMC6 And NSE5 INteracting (CANIN) domain-containing protein n=1 Tax=Aegilops tauschii TaxID=37682 RepID=M8CCU2_AEGTA
MAHLLRKKVIGLDDLVEDYFNSGKDELKASAAKSKGRPKGDNSDDEDRQVRKKEIDFCKFVEECEEKAKAMDPGEDVPQWGQQVFGCQKSPSVLNSTGVENCQLLQSFCGDEQLGFDLEIERGEGFFEGMLINGWLLKLVLLYGSVEDSIASWVLTKYTSDGGPPQNITAWLRVVSACCKIRKMHAVFSPSEAEDVLVIVISLFLDRRLEGLLLILGDCLNSLISYFNTSEWESSCLIVAESISKRVKMDLNCLRLVDCITGTNDRSKFLRSQLALQLLKNSFGLKVANVERILKSVTSINVKEKECNFFMLYVHIVLMDNLLFSSDAFRNKTAIIDAWRIFLRNCSTHIGCTDWRFYASKVRNKASYLLQGAMLKRPAGSGNIPAK